MARNVAPRKRQVGRELLTVLLAFLLATSLGKSILTVVQSPPVLVTALVFVVLYAAFYFAVWRLTEKFWRS